MARQELARFLRDRREGIRPSDVGLPPGARRRTPGLRREEVASLACLSVEYLARLEQARGPRSGTPTRCASPATGRKRWSIQKSVRCGSTATSSRCLTTISRSCSSPPTQARPAPARSGTWRISPPCKSITWGSIRGYSSGRFPPFRVSHRSGGQLEFRGLSTER